MSLVVTDSLGLSASVLVLNRHYLPLRVVNAKRAFCMLLCDHAEVVHEEDGQYVNHDFESWLEVSEFKRQFEPASHDFIRTVRFEIAVPRIVRLLGYDRLPRQEVKFNRRNIFARDHSRCQYCGHKFPTSELSLDHVVPRSQGGKTTWENMVCCCLKCNIKKGGQTPDQARMKLITHPVKPKRSPVISLRLGEPRYKSWKAFLDQAYWSVELK